MAHINKIKTKTGKIRYKAVVEISSLKDVRKRKTKRFIRKKDAENWLSEIVNTINKGTYITEDKNITLGDFLDKWLEKKKLTIQTTTHDRYKNKINAHLKPILGEILLQELKPIHLDDYFTLKRKKGRKDGKKGGLSENTLKKHYVILNSCLKKAKALELIRKNPLAKIKTPSPEKKEADVMTIKESELLLKNAESDPLMYTFLFTLLKTGMRRGEILGLEWHDLDFKKNIIKVEKSLLAIEGGIILEDSVKNESSKRKIPMTPKLIKVLKNYKKKQNEYKDFYGDEYYNDENYVFCKPNGKPYHPNSYNKKLNKILKKAGLNIKYGNHTLRHTFATILLIKKGVSIKIVQKLLGHSVSATTIDTYAHADISNCQNAIAKLDT